MNTARPHTTTPKTELAQSLHAKRPVSDCSWVERIKEASWNTAGSNFEYDTGLEPEVTVFGSSELLRMQGSAPILGRMSMWALSADIRHKVPSSYKKKAIYTPINFAVRSYREGMSKKRILILELTNTRKFDAERNKITTTIETSAGRPLGWGPICPVIKLIPLADTAELPETFLQDLRAFLPKTITAAPGYVEPVEVARIG